MTIRREDVAARTLELKTTDVPHITNNDKLSLIFKDNFSKTDTELYQTMDAFFWAILEAVIKEMKSRGVKQPSVNTFLESFNCMNATNLFIGTMRIENEIFTKERKDEIVKECIETLEKKYKNGIEEDHNEKKYIEKLKDDQRFKKWDE